MCGNKCNGVNPNNNRSSHPSGNHNREPLDWSSSSVGLFIGTGHRGAGGVGKGKGRSGGPLKGAVSVPKTLQGPETKTRVLLGKTERNTI